MEPIPATAPVSLTSIEAQHRLDQHGRNEVPDRRPHLVVVLLQKFWRSIPCMLEATKSESHARTTIVAIVKALMLIDAFLVCALLVYLAPVNLLLIAALLAIVIIYLLILDQFKVVIFRRFKIH